MGRTKRVRYPYSTRLLSLLLHFLYFLHHHSVCHIWLAYVGHIYIPVLFYDLAPHRFNVCCVPLLVVTYLYGCLLHAPSAGHPPPHSQVYSFIYTYSIVIYMWLYFGCNLWLFKVVAFVSLGTQIYRSIIVSAAFLTKQMTLQTPHTNENNTL